MEWTDVSVQQVFSVYRAECFVKINNFRSLNCSIFHNFTFLTSQQIDKIRICDIIISRHVVQNFEVLNCR